jgi:hypothetical protein
LSSLVSFVRAVPVAAALAAADLYFNQGRVVGAVALGALGGFVVKSCLYLRSKCCGSITPFQDLINPVKNQKGVSIPVERLKNNFPKEYQSIVQSEKLFSEEDILKFFTQRLLKGCCAGTADALFSKIIQKESHSLVESERLLKSEDVFYHQILVAFLQEDIEHGNARHLQDFCKGIHYGFFTDSASFSVEAHHDIYRHALENATLRFPKEQDFMGVIHLPNHVISFQYGAQGCYFIDTMYPDAKVMKFDDPDTFFENLRAYVVHDSEYILAHNAKKKMSSATPEEIREVVAKEMDKNYTTFSIKPL